MICRILNISKDNNNGLMNIKYSLKYLDIVLYGFFIQNIQTKPFNNTMTFNSIRKLLNIK